MADGGPFESLLEVQSLDTAADQLRHRREHLPERAALIERQSELAELDRRAGQVQAERDQIASSEKRLEDEISMVTEKATSVDQKLYSGTVSVPRELTAMQDEIDSLKRRQRQLEDQELELMEQAEPLDAALAELSAARTSLDEDAVRLTAVVAEAEASIDEELDGVLANRADAMSAVPAPLLSEYESLRKGLGGIGVARLSGNRCEGCHLTLSAVDVDRIRHEPDDALVHCTECGRLLVRV